MAGETFAAQAGRPSTLEGVRGLAANRASLVSEEVDVDSSLRYFGCVVGFGFGVVWMTVGLGAAILCLLLAGLGYGVVFVAGRAQAEGITRRRWSERPKAEASLLDEVELDHEPAEDAMSPLAAEADYGWPVATPEMAHTESR
jgi:hypothetical protein